jgi:LuxR family transcriptional regulator, maltose regulon positive regulatory protein
MASRRRVRNRSLPAKLILPDPVDAIRRPRVFRALDRLTKRRITWVHAPAGAGKTTVVATHLRVRGFPALWYEVDSGDADEGALYHYLRIGAEALTGRKLELPTPHPGPPPAQQTFRRRFFEALFAELPPKTVLAFDDVDETCLAGPWEEAFRELCSAITPRMHVIVTSRLPPPASLTRWGASGELGLLGWESLRLDAAEVRRFLEREHAMTENESAAHAALADGWAVAVTLLAKRDPSRPARSLAHFEDNLESVFDYLASEIFDRLPKPTQTLLLRISLLPTFTASMAGELAEQPDAERILSDLRRDHLLLVRHGATDFRLHDLFRAFLLRRGRRQHGAAAWNELSSRAAELLAEHQQLTAAIDLLVASSSWPSLCNLVEKHAPVLASQGRLPTLGATLERIPPALRSERPWLLYWYAVTALGQPGDRARARAEAAFHGFRASRDVAGALLAWATLMQAIILGGNDYGAIPAWLRTLDQVRRRSPRTLAKLPPEIAIRVATSEVLAWLSTEAGGRRSLEIAGTALELVKNHGSPEDRALVRGVCTALYAHGGASELVEVLVQRGREHSPGGAVNPFARLTYLNFEALVGVTRAEFGAALRAADEGLRLGRASGMEMINEHYFCFSALAHLGRGDLDRAALFLESASATVADTRHGRGFLAYLRGMLAFERGDLDAAIRWSDLSVREATNLSFPPGLCLARGLGVIARASAGNQNDLATAVRHLDELLEGSPGFLFRACAEFAKIFARLCNGADVTRDLRTQLARLRKSDTILPAFLGRRVVSSLVSYALEHEIEPDFTRRMLSAWDLRPNPANFADPTWPWSVRVRAFGPLSLEVGDKPVRFGRKPPTVPLALLKVLIAAGEPITVAQLTRALWPGSAHQSQRGSLDTALYRLRKLIGADAIVSQQGRISLAGDQCWSDVRALAFCCDRIAAIATQRATTNGHQEIEGAEQRLLDLYRGPLGLDDDPSPVLRARERSRRRFAQAIAELERLWRGAGAPERAEALGVVAADRLVR